MKASLKLLLLATLLAASPAWAQESEVDDADLDPEEEEVDEDSTRAHLLIRKARWELRRAASWLRRLRCEPSLGPAALRSRASQVLVEQTQVVGSPLTVKLEVFNAGQQCVPRSHLQPFCS